MKSAQKNDRTLDICSTLLACPLITGGNNTLLFTHCIDTDKMQLKMTFYVSFTLPVKSHIMSLRLLNTPINYVTKLANFSVNLH